MPRWLAVSVTLVLFTAVILAVGSGTAIAQNGGFPRALIGLWAESPITCDLLKRSPADAPSNRSWVRITPETVSGTTNGRFIKALTSRSARTTDDKLSSITIDFELSRDGILFETVTGARASMQYARCR